MTRTLIFRTMADMRDFFRSFDMSHPVRAFLGELRIEWEDRDATRVEIDRLKARIRELELTP